MDVYSPKSGITGFDSSSCGRHEHTKLMLKQIPGTELHTLCALLLQLCILPALNSSHKVQVMDDLKGNEQFETTSQKPPKLT